jgi:regulatory protein
MPSSYLDGLKMLARRELSEAQVRERLARRGHDPASIEEAVSRLKRERALDDERVANAIARTEATVKRRGKLRVRRQIERAGIAPATARRAVDDLFTSIDGRTLIEAALARRLRGAARIETDAQFARLYRYLASQGFEADEIVRVLKSRSVQ